MTAAIAGDFVVATAGHVDHGKSTLVRTLTGIEPDRWAEERRRGLTIDLGFAWTTLPSGRRVSFVDVPGHERFLGNMLAGLGPSAVVCFVVAADAGWQPQSADHRDAIQALGIEHGVIVLSRIDRIAGDPAAVQRRLDVVHDQIRTEFAETGLHQAPVVAISAVGGIGLDTFVATLDDVLAGIAAPPDDARVRLWIDRSFTISGAGTVVTGTLSAGRIAVGDKFQLCGSDGLRTVQIRSLQRHGETAQLIGPSTRVAVNLRTIAAESVHRGDALLSPEAWSMTDVVDVRRISGSALDRAPVALMAHVGTAAVPVRLRPFGADLGRLTLAHRLPLVLADRIVLRDPGSRSIFAGVQVLDPAPPQLTRRGAGARRRTALSEMSAAGNTSAEVVRRGFVRPTDLQRWGFPIDPPPASAVEADGWWIDPNIWQTWQTRLHDLAARAEQDDPLGGGVSDGAAIDRLGLPAAGILTTLAESAGLEAADGRLRLPGSGQQLGAAADAIAEVERRLADAPFAAPEADELTRLGLGGRELAAAERSGRLIRLGAGVVLLPTAPALARHRLAALPQPFTLSQARQALQTTRRVAIPLLEQLDRRGWTRRVDPGHREVVG